MDDGYTLGFEHAAMGKVDNPFPEGSEQYDRYTWGWEDGFQTLNEGQ